LNAEYQVLAPRRRTGFHSGFGVAEIVARKINFFTGNTERPKLEAPELPFERKCEEGYRRTRFVVRIAFKTGSCLTFIYLSRGTGG
jgi:hypothetical protein